MCGKIESATLSSGGHVYFLGRILKSILAANHVRVSQIVEILQLLELLVVTYVGVVCCQAHQIMDLQKKLVALFFIFDLSMSKSVMVSIQLNRDRFKEDKAQQNAFNSAGI